MGHKHTKEEILAGAVAVAFESGLSQLTYGRVAKQLGINDRTVVYYFRTKDVLISEVLLAIGARLQDTLAPALETTKADHVALVRTIWPILATPVADPVFALFFEANGLATTGREPYRSLVPQLIGAWLDWTESYLDGDAAERRAEAEAVIALVDGLLLVRLLAGAEAGDRAAQRLGVLDR